MAAAHALLSLEPLGSLELLESLELLGSLEILESLGTLDYPEKTPLSLDINQVSFKNQTFF